MPKHPANPPDNKRPIHGSSGPDSDPDIEVQLDTVLQRLYALFHTEIDLSLDRTYRFLKRLDDPHLKLPRTVHVAGTNGKGSTVATLRALLEASGHSVHVYTSPHLVHPTERIRLAGQLIGSRALLALLNECIEMNGDDPITFFEMFTCAALLAFSRVPADYLILETGMGGRLDATNVVPNPAATIITTISRDHTKFLGETLPEIAAEKAGIMKPGVPCVIGYQFPEAVDAGVMEVFQRTSQTLPTAAPLVRYGAEWSSASESGRMLFRYGDDSILTRKPVLYGNHQIWNAGAALAAFRIMTPDHFRPEILSTGLGQIHWPGRLQTLENHPFNALVPDGWEIIIDGGHNDSAGLVLAAQMEEWARTDPKPLHLIVAMVNRKDPVAFLKPLLPYVSSLTMTEIEGEEASFKAEELAITAEILGFSSITTTTAREALRALVNGEGGGVKERVLLTGSLFLMGEILSQIKTASRFSGGCFDSKVRVG